MNVNSDGTVGGGMSQSASADAGRGGGGMFLTVGNGGAGGGGTSRGVTQKKSTNHSTFLTHNAAYTGLAGGEDQSDDDCDAEYAQVQEIYPGADGVGGGGGMGAMEQQMYTFSQDTTPNKGSKLRPQRNLREKGAGGSKWLFGLFVVQFQEEEDL